MVGSAGSPCQAAVTDSYAKICSSRVRLHLHRNVQLLSLFLFLKVQFKIGLLSLGSKTIHKLHSDERQKYVKAERDIWSERVRM